MDGIFILYKTRYGSTQQYAEWLAELLPGSQIFDLEIVKPSALQAAKTIIICSRTYMGKIQAQDFLEKYWLDLQATGVFLLAVGMVPPDTQLGKASFDILPAQIRNGLAGYWKLPGRIQESTLDVGDRLILQTTKLKAENRMNRALLQPIADEIQRTLGRKSA